MARFKAVAATIYTVHSACYVSRGIAETGKTTEKVIRLNCPRAKIFLILTTTKAAAHLTHFLGQLKRQLTLLAEVQMPLKSSQYWSPMF